MDMDVCNRLKKSKIVCSFQNCVQNSLFLPYFINPTVISQKMVTFFVVKVKFDDNLHQIGWLKILRVCVTYTNRSKTNCSLGSVWSKMSTFQMGVVSRIVLPRQWQMKDSIPLLRAIKWGTVCKFISKGVKTTRS